MYGSDGNLITTPRFILVVDSRVVHDEDFPLSEEEQTILDNIILSETKRQANETEREQTHEEMKEAIERATDLSDTIEQKLETGDYDGKDGITPHIGSNGNWWIGTTDTGVLAGTPSGGTIDLPLSKGTGKDSIQQTSSAATEEKAVALGVNTQAQKRASLSGGVGTIANTEAQTVLGRYNNLNPNALLIVGNGTSRSAPSNALEVLADGKLNFDKSEFSKVATGDVESILTVENSAQVRKITMSFGFEPNIVFVRCKDLPNGFSTVWVNGVASDGTKIALGERNSLTFTFRADMGVVFTFVAIAKDSKQVISGGTSGGTTPEEPEGGGGEGDSDTIMFYLNWQEKSCPKDSTWQSITDDKIIDTVRYYWEGNLLYDDYYADYVMDESGDYIHPDTFVTNGMYYGAGYDYKPYILTITNVNTNKTDSFTIDSPIDMTLQTWADSIGLSYEGDPEYDSVTLQGYGTLYGSHFNPISWYDFQYSVVASYIPQFYCGDLSAVTVLSFTDNGKTFTQFLTKPTTCGEWVREKYPNYVILTEKPLYVIGKGHIRETEIDDELFETFYRYKNANDKFGKTEYPVSYSYRFTTNDVSFILVKTDGTETVFTTGNIYTGGSTPWTWEEFLDFNSMEYTDTGDGVTISGYGFLNVDIDSVIEPKKYICTDYSWGGSFMIYIDGELFQVGTGENISTRWADILPPWKYKVVDLSYLDGTKPSSGYGISMVDVLTVLCDEEGNFVDAYDSPQFERVYTSKVMFSIKNKYYLCVPKPTWRQFATLSNYFEENDDGYIVHVDLRSNVYNSRTGKLVIGNEVIEAGGTYDFDDFMRDVHFTIDGSPYTVSAYDGLIHFGTWLVGNNDLPYEVEEGFGYIKHKTTEKYLYDSYGNKVDAGREIIYGSAYYCLTNAITTVDFTIIYYVDGVPYVISDTVAEGTKWAEWVEGYQNGILLPIYGNYVSVDGGSSYVSYNDVPVNAYKDDIGALTYGTVESDLV